MKTLFITFSLVLLASCGAKKEYHEKLSVHPEAQAFVQVFEDRQGMTITDLQLSFAKDTPNRLGYCSRQRTVKRETKLNGEVVDHIYQTPVVVLNTEFWNSPYFTLAQKEQLVFHELGHCIMGRDHTPTSSSLMFAYALSAYEYTSNYANLMSEFFTNKRAVASFTYFDPTEYALTAQVEVEAEEIIHPEGDNCVHDHGETVIETTEVATEE